MAQTVYAHLARGATAAVGNVYIAMDHWTMAQNSEDRYFTAFTASMQQDRW
jgi:hypothetical protein